MADNSLKESLRKFNQNLNILREREAKYAGNPPLDLLNQIKDHQQAIALTRQALDGDLDEVEYRESLKPLLVSLEKTQTIIDQQQQQVETQYNVAGDMIIYNYPPHPPAPETEPAEAEEDIPPCPYRGLFAFRPEHAPFFFGRESFTQSLVAAVESRALVAVLGASGSGKSSVVFAGLVPSLLNRPGEPWLFTTFRPGDDPFLNLANALTPLYEESLSKTDQLLAARKLAAGLQSGELALTDVFKLIQQTRPDHQLLLIADQFEELYTLCRESDCRHQFLDLLLTAVHPPAHSGAESHNFILPPSSFRLILTLRADFLGQASLYRPFADALQGTTELLGPMTQAELTAAIEKPAQLQGVSFEANLVDRLLDDIGAEEGSLPLLEFALTELWQHQTQRTLTHVAYEEIGEVKGALSRHADKAYQRLTLAEQEQARRVFVQLVNPGAGTEDTRRLATRTELEQNWTLVARLANERLVVTNQLEDEQDTVEVVHEALIRHWNQLQLWMNEDRTFRAWQERLRFSLAQWQQANQDEDALLRGAPLAEAEGWLAERSDDLSQAEQDYINAGLQQRRRQERRQRLLLSGAIVAALVMAVLGGLSFWLFTESNQQRAAVEVALITVQAAEADAIQQKSTAQAAEADAVQQKATALAASDELAQQLEAAEAELNFSRSNTAEERLDALVRLIELGRGDMVGELLWGLPSQAERSAVFTVEDERLVGVTKAVYVTLADVNRTGYADPLLEAMVTGLTNLPDATIEADALQTELEQWLQARQQAREGHYEDALAEYDKLILLNEHNPAVLYERARVLAGLGQYEAALGELERTVALANDSSADTEQLIQAVGRLIYWVEPELGKMFDSSRVGYPKLKEAGSSLAGATEIKMVLVEAGPFEMGSESGDDDEKPVHTVTLEDFQIDQYEVTNAQYAACVDAGVCEPPVDTASSTRDSYYGNPGYDDYPVIYVSWYQAKAYCEWRGLSLPTEAQWEKAARGADGRPYPWGEEIDCTLANYYGCVGDTRQVGSHPAGVSPYGAYDMAGNVWEWVADWYDRGYYKVSPSENPLGPDENQNTISKVLRGGSWYNTRNYTRASNRSNIDPDSQFNNFGFRCAGVLRAP